MTISFNWLLNILSSLAKHRIILSVGFAILSMLISGPLALGQEQIYKWTDSQGQVHYSNTPVKNAAPASLPKIKKENLEKKIENIKLNIPKNCQSRGGIDCARGADTDGSVFCIDGFADSRLPFRFYCVEAQLVAQTRVSEVDRDTKEMTVTLRNNSPVEAKNVSVYFRYREGDKVMGKKQKLELSGKSSIPPYGLEDYSCTFPANSRLITTKAIDRGKPVLRCDNCSSLRYKR
jgi:hypothetical protein